MATANEQCPQCGNNIDAHIGQGITHGDELVWSLGMKCFRCGFSREADDRGFPPENYRQHILGQDGVWNVVVLDERDRNNVALIARSLFDLSAREAVQFARRIPGIVYSGTECEAIWLKRHCQRRGVLAEVRPGKTPHPR